MSAGQRHVVVGDLVYVRTTGETVPLHADSEIPVDVLPEHLEQLITRGLVAEAPASVPRGGVTPTSDVPPAKPRAPGSSS